MCSRGCSGCAGSGMGPSILDHYGGGSTTCGCSSGPGGPGTTSLCLRRIFASNYNSSLCEASLECPLGNTSRPKRRHRLDNAPLYRARNWWKSGNQCVAECIDGPVDESQEKTTIDNTENRREVITRPVPSNDVLARVEALLAALPVEA